jgi:hypothetical protein
MQCGIHAQAFQRYFFRSKKGRSGCDAGYEKFCEILRELVEE